MIVKIHTDKKYFMYYKDDLYKNIVAWCFIYICRGDQQNVILTEYRLLNQEN
jgi:hypothetical protein